MSEVSSEERAEAEAGLMRQGAGNYANLCGVLAGFVAVIIVLVETPGFFPKTDGSVVYELDLVLFTISVIGYIITAWSFIGISHKGLWDYKSYEDMAKDFDFCQALVVLFTAVFLGGVVVLSYSQGTVFMTVTAFVGFVIVVVSLIRSWWALTKRPRPKKN